MNPPSDITLRRIRVYPLKGAGGLDLEETALDDFGIPGDRRWMLSTPGGQFLSQRTHPRLALVQTFATDAASGEVGSPPGLGVAAESTDSGSFGPAISGPNTPQGCPSFRVEAPEMGSTFLEPRNSGEWIRVRVHKDRFEALAGFDDADSWFSEFLGETCRLVFIPNELVRPVDPQWAPGYRVGLADGYPLHLTSEESLSDLNARLASPTSMLRYRPNLVVAGGAAWEEDEWRVLDMDGTRIELVKPCARCTVVTVDPGSATRGKEPLRTMKDFREWDGNVYFGQNAVVAGSGRFRVGSSVRILERGPRRPPLPVTS
jgi:uncharacterized protein YcbX